MPTTAAACEHSARAAGDWLAAQLIDGGLASLGFDDLYKVVYALALDGKVALANEVLDHIVRIAGTDEPGNFSPAPTSPPDFASVMLWYRHAVLLMGASQLGRWDVASPAAMDALAAQIVDVGGGCGGVGIDGFLLVCPSAMIGLVLLRNGRTRDATRLGRFFMKLWASDKSQFNMMWDANAGDIVTDANAPAWLRGRSVVYVVKPGLERQHFYATGIAAALLSELYAATGERSFLVAAAELVAFDTTCRWEGGAKLWPSKCKVAWGAACLLRFGLDELLQPASGLALSARAVAEHTAAVAQHCFLDNQHASGHYGPFHFPVCDRLVERLPAGTIHWEPAQATACGATLGDDYFVGSEIELAAEYIYELYIVSRGLAVVAGAPRSRL